MRRPRPLWSAWDELARRVAAASGVALFSDFDGTLSPIARRPSQPRLPRATRRALERLHRLPHVAVGVVSGRSLTDIRRRIGLARIYYIGSHGVEWAGPGGFKSPPVGRGFLARLRALGAALEARLGHLPGVYVEHKSVSVAVHYRLASPKTARQAGRVVRRLAKERGKSVRLLEGKKVLELLPPGRLDKGGAVLKAVSGLQQRWGRRPLVIYLGDDITDEAVFRRLRPGDLSIHVGAGGATRARYRLESSRRVRRFLERLEEVRA